MLSAHEHTTPKTVHAFISHSSEDAEWARRICDRLESQGLKCWIAPRDILPGSEWGAAIIDGIDQSRLLLLVFSQRANESAQVRREVERAIGKSIPVLPVRIEDIRPHGSLEFALSNTHWLDAFASPVEDRLQQLVLAVESLLGIRSDTPRTAPETVTQVAPTTSRRPVNIRNVAIWALAILTLGLVAAVASNRYWRPATDEIGDNEETENVLEEKAEAAVPVESAYEKFQGFWRATAHSFNDRKVPPFFVEQINATLMIRSKSTVYRHNPRPNTAVTITGALFIDPDNQNHFTIRGQTSDGKVCIWNGVYQLTDEVLELCYRDATGTQGKRIAPAQFPIAPETMMRGGEAGTRYIKLERSVRRPKAK